MADDKKLDIVIRLKDGFSKNMKGITGAMSSFTKGIFSLKGLIVGGAAGALGKQIVDITSKFEQWQVAFETLTGSTEKANKLLADLKDLAKETPFELPGLIESSKRLLAMGIETEKVVETTRMLGDITAGVGKEKMPQLILAFGQVKTAGRLMGQELRQFNEAGVDLLGGIAKNLGKTKQEVKEMVSAGEIGFADVENALRSMTSEGGQFFRLMEKQSKTFGGTVSNIHDNLGMLALEIGNQLLPYLKEMATAIKEFTEERKNITRLTNGVITLINYFLSLDVTINKVKGYFSIFFKTVEKGFVGIIKGIIKADLFIVKSAQKAINKVLKIFGKKTKVFEDNLESEKKELEKYEREILEIESDIAKEKKRIADSEVAYNKRKLSKIKTDEKDTLVILNDGYDSHVALFKKQNEEKTEIATKNAKKQADKELEVYRQFARDILSESDTFGQDVSTFINGLTKALIEGPDGLIKGMEKSLNEVFPKEFSAFLSTTTGGAISGFVNALVTSIFGNEPTKSVAEEAEDQFKKMVKNTDREIKKIGKERTITEKRLDLIRNLLAGGQTAVKTEEQAMLLGATVGETLDSVLTRLEKERLGQEKRETSEYLKRYDAANNAYSNALKNIADVRGTKTKAQRKAFEGLTEEDLVNFAIGGLSPKEFSKQLFGKEYVYGTTGHLVQSDFKKNLEAFRAAYNRMQDVGLEFTQEQIQGALDVFDIQEEIADIRGENFANGGIVPYRKGTIGDRYKIDGMGFNGGEHIANTRQQANLIHHMANNRGAVMPGSTQGASNGGGQTTVILEADGIKLAEGVVQGYNRGITQRRVTRLKGA